MGMKPRVKRTSNEIPVLVCTDKRGVFFGWCREDAISREQMTLRDCRMAVYWAVDVRGVVGLAATGPNAKCRVTPAVSEMLLTDIHGVARCSVEAVKAWESEPWG